MDIFELKGEVGAVTGALGKLGPIWVETLLDAGAFVLAMRRGHASAWTGSGMSVWGGDGGSPAPFLGDGALYDPATDAWTPVSASGAPAPRQEASAVTVGGLVVVWGGYDAFSLALAVATLVQVFARRSVRSG